MPFNTYDLGELVDITSEFTRKSNGTPLDPDSVFLAIRSPDDIVRTYQFNNDAVQIKAADESTSTEAGGLSYISHDDTGDFSATINANEHGHWYYRWFSTGNGQAAEEKHFIVRQPRAI
jgi:hypothetical protein